MSATTWRPGENSYSALLAEISKALQACTGYEGNSQLLADDATAFDFGMQMAHRTFDENGVRRVKEPNEKERANMIDNGWFERRDESTLDERTHNAKFHKELLAHFKKTEGIKQTRTDATVFPVAPQAIDAKPNMVSATLVLLTVLAQKTAQENRMNPQHTYQSWHETLQVTLNETAESHGIPFPIFLYNISPFWVPTMVQRENSLDEQQVRLYVEAMQRATIAEILAYLMAVGLGAVYEGPVHLVQRLVLAKANSCLLSFLIFAKNQRNWINAILNTLDPAGALKLRAQLAENIKTLLAWVYSAWVNVSGVMSTLDDSLSQKPNSNNLPGFLFPSQVASLMLVETEDLVPMIAPIVWPIFGSMMALRYPTQPLRVAAKAPTLSILHFVDPEDDTRQPDFQMLVRNFANFRPPMAYTIIKDKKQVEYSFSALIRARARCAVPMSLELHPVEWLHAPVEPTTGALQGFASWDEPGILRVLTNAERRLGGRRKGSTPERLQHRVIQDVSRMYNPRVTPQADTAKILSDTTHWADPPIVDRMIYQGFQTLKATVPKIAREPNRKTLPLNEEMPNNPQMAMEIFMSLIAKQRDEGNTVYDSYLIAIGTFKETFLRYGRQDLADQLPELSPAGSTSMRQAAGHEEASTAENTSTSMMSTSSQISIAIAATPTNTNVPIHDPETANPTTIITTNATSNDQTVPLEALEVTPTSLTRTLAADIELELIDNGWFERRDESTLDERTHNAKFHKELLALFKKTEGIKQTRTDATVFPVATQAIDAKPNMVSPTLVLLTVLAQKTAQENRMNPQHTYQSWHETLQVTLNETAESHGIPFPIFLYNIAPFWVPTMVQGENSLDEQQVRLYVEAMQRATIAEILAYLMAVGLGAVYKGPVHLVQRLVLAKANSCLLSFLIFAKNKRNWINAILNTLDPAGALKLRAQLAENIETLLAWVYSAWVNVSGVMSTLDDSLSQKPNSNNLPGFLFPSQVASLMLVETEDLVPMIAPIVLPIFGSMMALRYPTQPLRVAAKAPTLSILHFVDPEDDTRQPDFQMLVRNFANFRPPMAYTIIKEKKQVEYNFSALIRARARCAVPMSLELHPVEWLHAPVEPTTGALQGFASWDEPGILRVLTNAERRLGGRRKGSTPERLQHRVIQDVSRMYNPRVTPQADTAKILSDTTHWADPPIVDRMIYQGFQTLKATVPKIAREPNRKTLPLNEEMPNNPQMAMEIFMSLIAKQRDEGNTVYDSYLNAIGTFKETFLRYGCQDLADQLPELSPAGSTSMRQAAGHEEASTAENTSTSMMSTSSQISIAIAATPTNTNVPIHDPETANPTTIITTNATSNDQTVPLEALEVTPTSLTRTLAADIELELNELPSLNQQDLPPSEALAVSLNEVLQNDDTTMDDTGDE